MKAGTESQEGEGMKMRDLSSQTTSKTDFDLKNLKIINSRLTLLCAQALNFLTISLLLTTEDDQLDK